MRRRGRTVLDGGTWTIRDPLGLHSRRVAAAPAGELLVLPRIEPVEVGNAAVAGLGAGPATAGDDSAASIREARAVEFEIDGLRPYREGSPASRIHWPAVARSGEMYERRMAAGAEAVPLVVLDAEYPDDEDSLDRAVRAAGSLYVHLAPATGAVLLPGHQNPTALDSGCAPGPRSTRGSPWLPPAPGPRARRGSATEQACSWVSRRPARAWAWRLRRRPAHRDPRPAPARRPGRVPGRLQACRWAPPRR